MQDLSVDATHEVRGYAHVISPNYMASPLAGLIVRSLFELCFASSCLLPRFVEWLFWAEKYKC